MNKKLYKNYRSKLSTPLISALETREIFCSNPRLIGRVFKFLGYIGFLQLNAKSPKKTIGAGSPKSRTASRKFLNREIFYNYNSSSIFYYPSQFYLTTSSHSNFLTYTYFSYYPPNYDTENGTRAPIFEPYILKLASIHWTKTEDILGEKYYSEVIRTLVDLGIIYCDFKSMKGEKTYWFAITETGYDLLNSSQTEYIYHKIYNRDEKRNRNKRIKRHGYQNKIYADPILQNAKAVIDGINNLGEMTEIAEGLKESSRLAANHLIDSIIEKDYKHLEILDHTGRFYSPMHMLPKPVKAAATINGKSLAMSVDVRSCHPSLFGLYVRSLTDCPSPELEAEIVQYNRLFCDPKNHPRDVIRAEILADFKRDFTNDEIKKGLNTFINGSRGNLKEGNPARYIRLWLEQNYPTIFAIWNRGGTRAAKQTGNNISKRWERAIFRAPEVLDKANELGIYIYDNHDELLIYGSKPKAKQFTKWFKARAKEVTGQQIQFSEKIAA